MHHTDSTTLSSATHQYLSTKRLEGYSPVTLDSYQRFLRRLADHLGDPPLHEITLEDLRAFLASLAHLKASSIGFYVRILRSTFAWFHAEELVDRNVTVKLREPKQAARIPKALTTEEMEALRDACRGPRERALVELFFATGGRLSEIAALDRAGVDWDRRAVTVFGKGSREREVYFGARAGIWLRAYLKARTDDHPALFVTATRQPQADGSTTFQRLATSSIRQAFGRIAARCGLKERVSPHVMRHTLATTLLNQGAPLAVVQSLLGHVKPQTTMLYVSLSGAQRKRDYERYFVQ